MLRIFLLFVVFASSVFAQGKIYSCRDQNGKMLTSDRPIPECANRPVQERGSSGTVVRTIPPPLTPEQRQQKELEKQKLQQQQEALIKQRRRDAALLASYPDEKAIEAVRTRSLADANIVVKGLNERLSTLTKAQFALEQEAEFYKNKPLPGVLRQKITDNTAALTEVQNMLANQQREIKRINQRFDEDKERLRTLLSSASHY